MTGTVKVNLEKTSPNGEIIPNGGASFKLTRKNFENLTILPDKLLDGRLPHFTNFSENPTANASHRAVAMIARGENKTHTAENNNFNALYFVELGDEWIAFSYREEFDEDGNLTPWHGEFYRLSAKAKEIVYRHY